MSRLEDVAGNPSALKSLSIPDLEQVAVETRQCIVSTVARTGGHLSSNLGVVDITLALHYVFDLDRDILLLDVGHQCYAHKILSGRLDRFASLRQAGGLSGFPDPAESPTDVFRTGHAGTAVSAASGLRTGRDLLGIPGRVVAVIGDGSLTNGVTFEALNHLGALRKNLLVVLNDNRMSISPTRGALSYYLARLATSAAVSRPREEIAEMLKRIPSIGTDLLQAAREIEKKAKALLVPGGFFEYMGLRYFGPMDGHDLHQMIEILKNVKAAEGPVVLHVITRKGKGYDPAERRPADFHSVGPFVPETGAPAAPAGDDGSSGVVGRCMEEIADKRPDVAVITAAMEKGLGLEGFAEKFPARFYDVGIAESHAVVFGAGLARAGMRVVVAIYSTFLQRAYDQILHDVCLQNLPLLFLVDRAGIAGEDGPTHHGAFDLSYLRTLPNLTVVAPVCLRGLREAVVRCLLLDGPSAIRYPRSGLPQDIPAVSGQDRGEVAILACGSMAQAAVSAGHQLSSEGISTGVFAVESVKPVDREVLDQAAASFRTLVTVEENSLLGGFGSSVLEYLQDAGKPCPVIRMGLPDRFIEHGQRPALLEQLGLNAQGIADRVRAALSGRRGTP